MTHSDATPIASQEKTNPFAAIVTFVSWVAATDRRFRRVQSMIEAPGIHF